MVEKAILLDEAAMGRAIARMSYQIVEKNKGVDHLAIIGIFSRGVEIAQRIAKKIGDVEGVQLPMGCLDITRHRDDIRPDETYQDRTRIPFDLNGKTVILVDDVMYTGRSVRAAIDRLMEQGRPQAIQLAVLIDRGHRELPFRPDYIGKNVPTSKSEQIRVFVTERDGIDKVSIVE